MALEDGIRQRKGMAMGGKAESGGSFGVENFHGMNGGPVMHPDAHMDSGKHMPEASRSISGNVGRGGGMMPAQKHPDHGPHHHRDEGGSRNGAFGVPSLKSENG